MDQNVRLRAAKGLMRIGVVLGVAGALVMLLLLVLHSHLSSGWATIMFGGSLCTLLGAVVFLRDASDHFFAISKGNY